MADPSIHVCSICKHMHLYRRAVWYKYMCVCISLTLDYKWFATGYGDTICLLYPFIRCPCVCVCFSQKDDGHRHYQHREFGEWCSWKWSAKLEVEHKTVIVTQADDIAIFRRRKIGWCLMLFGFFTFYSFKELRNLNIIENSHRKQIFVASRMCVCLQSIYMDRGWSFQ